MDKIKSQENNITSSNNISNIIFVIGESLQKWHMGLYGYALDTTPNLSNLSKKGNLIYFNDVVSPGPNTDSSLSKVLNFSNYESDKNGKKWYETLSLVDMMNISGYETFWLSNQSSPAYFSSAIYTSQMRSNEHFVIATNDMGTIGGGREYDEMLLKPLLKISSNANKNKFIVLHLYGNHMDYIERFPAKFAKFGIDEAKKFVKYSQNLDNKKIQIVADYDNSVLYNDFIIYEIFKMFSDKNTLILYFSDHGQIVYEDKKRIGHCFDSGLGYEIPLIFVASDKFITTFPQIWQNIQNAKNSL